MRRSGDWDGANLPRILVNNAATAKDIPLKDVSPEDLEREFGVNVFGTVYMIQAVVGAGKMPKGGRIINVGSIASKTLPPVGPVYCAAKAAQDSLTTLWAGEVR
jgi:NAD(P)-dependent dehydrogenase (short-subunit alcohol dehydrogenase family)